MSERASVVNGVSDTSVIKPDPAAGARVKAEPEAAIDSSSQETQGSNGEQKSLSVKEQAAKGPISPNTSQHKK
ncbi:TPA: hypothetical protein ACH3X1_012186 [Trebouxia sp. C0004]